MAREIHASIEDADFRRVRVAAAEADVNVSALLRSLVRLFIEDPKIRERVVKQAEPERRGRPRSGTD
jgi:hypothetical protein